MPTVTVDATEDGDSEAFAGDVLLAGYAGDGLSVSIGDVSIVLTWEQAESVRAALHEYLVGEPWTNPAHGVPPDDQPVLVLAEPGGPTVAWWDGQEWLSGDWAGKPGPDILWWMPIPDRPKPPAPVAARKTRRKP